MPDPFRLPETSARGVPPVISSKTYDPGLGGSSRNRRSAEVPVTTDSPSIVSGDRSGRVPQNSTSVMPRASAPGCASASLNWEPLISAGRSNVIHPALTVPPGIEMTERQPVGDCTSQAHPTAENLRAVHPHALQLDRFVVFEHHLSFGDPTRCPSPNGVRMARPGVSRAARRAIRLRASKLSPKAAASDGAPARHAVRTSPSTSHSAASRSDGFPPVEISSGGRIRRDCGTANARGMISAMASADTWGPEIVTRSRSVTARSSDRSSTISPSNGPPTSPPKNGH